MIVHEYSQSATDFVLSKDGARIGYRQVGNGPGLVIVHGAMESSASHMQLAEALADSFRIIMPDRRGRCNSGAHSPAYCMQKEVEDVEALLAHTGAHYVFGVSSGALISLQSALALPAIRRLAIFEPPLLVNGSLSMAFLSRYESEIAQGHLSSALVTGMKGAKMGPPIFNAMPRWLLRRLTEMMMAAEDRKAEAGDATFRTLAPTLKYDFQLVAEMNEQWARFEKIPVHTILLGGSKSPAYLKKALDVLEQVIPGAERIEFPGLGHGASGNNDRGGRPETVALALRRFFKD